MARRHLAALEKGDLDALPPGPFAKGYIEAYARVLGIDAGPVVDAYRGEAQKRGAGTPEAEGRMLDELAQIVERRAGGAAGDRGPAPWKAIAIGAGAVVALALGSWLVLRDASRGEDPAASPTPPPPSVASEPAARSPDTSLEATTPPERTPGPAPTARAEPTPTPEPPRPNPNLTISASGVGTGVENHQLVGGAEEFPVGAEVVFWTRVVGGRPGDVIHHVWLHEGRGIARIPLTIGSSPWRTFSRRPLPAGSTGHWTAEARTLDGRLLARQEFTCVAAGQ